MDRCAGRLESVQAGTLLQHEIKYTLRSLACAVGGDRTQPACPSSALCRCDSCTVKLIYQMHFTFIAHAPSGIF